MSMINSFRIDFKCNYKIFIMKVYSIKQIHDNWLSEKVIHYREDENYAS